MKSPVYLEAVSIAAPGLTDWSKAQTVLRGEQAYIAYELPPYQPSLLPPNERRRASATVRMAFRVAEAATQSSSVAAADLASVFASSDGDLTIAHRICTALATVPRLISPTDFHNSVHNAAAGYWSIASLARGPSTTIAAFDNSFAVGLQEALGMVVLEQRSTLLVAYDVPSPAPLQLKRPMHASVGIAMVLTPQRTQRTLASLRMQLVTEPVSTMNDAALEALRVDNPAARALPFLALLAKQQSGTVMLAARNDVMAVHVEMPSAMSRHS